MPIRFTAMAVLVFSLVCSGQQTDWIQQIKNKPMSDARTYNFTAQQPGGSLTSATPATITEAPCQATGSWTHFYQYISAGSGTAEAVLITGGTCTYGATTGTITFTPGNSHSGAWTVGSAYGGACEALYVAGSVVIPTSVNFYAPCYLSGTALSVDGLGTGKIVNQTLTSDAFILNACLHCSISNLIWDHATASLSSGVNGSVTAWTVSSPLAPTTPFYAYVGNAEIVQVTGIAGTAWTVVRARLGTTGTSFSSGALITIAQGGADIDVTGNSYQFTGHNLKFFHGYRSLYFVAAPGSSNWSDLYSEAVNYRHIDSPANNGEQVVNFTGNYSVDDGIHVGPGSGCIGTLTFTNFNVYRSGNDNIHVEGTSLGTPCQYTNLFNGQTDSANVNGLYVKNSSSFVATGLDGGNNGNNGILFGPNSFGVISSSNIGGSGKEGMLVSNAGGTALAQSLNLSNVTLVNNGTLSSSTYYGLHVDSTAYNLNVTGLQSGNVVVVPQLGGILIDSGAAAVHMSGLQFPGLAAANYVSSATSNTDVVLELPPIPFANLPTAPQSAGTKAYCPTCTTASTCAGSGSGHMAVSNGTNWTCN